MHRTTEELVAGLPHIKASPRSSGRLEAIVVRPERDARQELNSCRLDAASGAEGDRWVRGLAAPPVPGGPNTDSQLTLMNARAAELLAGKKERWALAGDQLYVDFDLSDDHLVAGDRLRIGDAVVEITAKAHNGCSKFSARYGPEALALVNSPEGKQLHLRGIYARVLTPGEVRVGDRIDRLSRAA